MQTTVTKLPKSRAEIRFSLDPADIAPDLEAAARRLSERSPIQGFRPGKAPYEVLKTRFGETAIWNEAIEDVVRRAYVKAVLEIGFQTVGAPEIALTKFAPGNPIEFTATVGLLPAVLSLPDLADLRVERKEPAVAEADVDAALAELRRMQARETPVERPAEKADKAVMDISIERDRVPIEGGQAKGHGVYLSEPYYIEGFTDHIVGMKKDERKTFTLRFPETHFQKQLAGRVADFTVTLAGVYEIAAPELDDAFAKTVGQESLAKLRALIKENLATEAAGKEAQRVEIAALDALVAKTSFEEIPDGLVDAEAEKMLHELEHSIAERGMEFDAYLTNIKKTRAELKLGFAPQALNRVKTVLALRALADRERIEVPDADVAAEVGRTMDLYADDAAAQERIRSEEYADMARNSLRNRKTIEYLREKIVKR